MVTDECYPGYCRLLVINSECFTFETFLSTPHSKEQYLTGDQIASVHSASIRDGDPEAHQHGPALTSFSGKFDVAACHHLLVQNMAEGSKRMAWSPNTIWMANPNSQTKTHWWRVLSC
jgi:hypothetical protein